MATLTANAHPPFHVPKAPSLETHVSAFYRTPPQRKTYATAITFPEFSVFKNPGGGGGEGPAPVPTTGQIWPRGNKAGIQVD